MTAITKVWTVPVASRQDPAVPITTSWGNDTWDNLQFLLEWLGGNYTAGAVQDHNHDGVNSAVVNTFAGLMPNGSFEDVSGGLPIDWTAIEYTGGTVASSSAVSQHGDQVVAITSTDLASGGGELIQNKYTAVTNNRYYGVEIFRWASVADVSCRVELVWYDAAKTQISTTILFDDTNTSLTANTYSNTVASPAGARFVRTKLTGGVPAAGLAAGTVYFDGGQLINRLPGNLVDSATISDGAVGTTELATDAVTLSKMANDSVGAAEIIAGSVHTSELNTLSASTSVSGLASASPVSAFYTPTGGYYVFNRYLATTTGAAYVVDCKTDYESVSDISGYTSRQRIEVTSNDYYGDFTMTGYAQWRYVSASPPHDMGDGEIPAFIYAVLDNKTQDIDMIAVAAEPVWLHNGPTNAMPAFWRKGKKYKIEKDVPANFDNLPAVERAIAIAELPDVEVEITNAITHADMDLIPHPFQGNDLTGKTVVMLDPVCDCVRNLADLDAAGENVHDIIRNKYITIGNTSLNRVTPAGLLIPVTAWKKPKKR